VRVLRLGAAALLALPAQTLGAGQIPFPRIESGLWQISEVRGALPPRSLCLSDPARLAQIEHGAARCRGMLVERNPRGGTIHYSCGAAGFGQTRLDVETPRHIKLDTQGMFRGRPFAYRAEARRVGRCAPAARR
jgi:hypothetical protein